MISLVGIIPSGNTINLPSRSKVADARIIFWARLRWCALDLLTAIAKSSARMQETTDFRNHVRRLELFSTRELSSYQLTITIVMTTVICRVSLVSTLPGLSLYLVPRAAVQCIPVTAPLRITAHEALLYNVLVKFFLRIKKSVRATVVATTAITTDPIM